MAESTRFLITIDTEGDNIWTRSPNVTTENALFLARFQDLCEEYNFRPTYLVNYEMAIDPNFLQFGRSALSRNVAEIGTHVHAWNSPPICGSDDWAHHSYQFEYSDAAVYDKLSFLTDLLTHAFGIRPVSHRAGRWGFDQRVAKALIELGYLVDCSVTPGVSWRKYKGAANGRGGPDFFGFPIRPYFIEVADTGSERQLLEVPVTIKPNFGPRLQRLHHSVEKTVPRGVLRRIVGPSHTWLRPTGHNTAEMLELVRWAESQALPALEFMLHSSELMPGGSPKFKTSEDIELLYKSLDELFRTVNSVGCVGMTLSEFRATWSDADVC